jgi:hypothetical protein
MTPSTMVRSDKQRRLASCCIPYRYCILALLLLFRFESTAAEDVTKKVHFMIEFVPTFPQNVPYQECESDEVLIIQDFVANVIHKDTGLSHKPHNEKFLDGYYNGGRHPGFDVTYECPDTCEGFPKASMDWCLMLCEDGHHHDLGHEALDRVAMDLKSRLHETSKGHDALFSVNCLGDLSKVDLHLDVATSPYQQKIAYDMEMSRRASKSAEL